MDYVFFLFAITVILLFQFKQNNCFIKLGQYFPPIYYYIIGPLINFLNSNRIN